jgi:citrate lyase subunit beta/citryl-CoA lyase
MNLGESLNVRPRRSALYMPAGNARAVEKARSLPCDVVILDLEDAVAPDAKPQARALAAEAVKAGGFGSREVVIRVNGLDTPWGGQDLRAAVEAQPDAILVPKVSSPEDVAAYEAHLSGRPRLWAMIETCASIFRLDGIAAGSASRRLEAWVIGTNDLAKEMRCRPGVGRAPLAGPLSLAVAAGRAQGLAVIDGVYNDIGDAEGLARQCAQGADFGFDGKSLIHPSQIEAANAAFSPAADEVAWARTVVAAFELPENAAKGALKVEGRMVERLHLAEARRVLALAAAIAAIAEAPT